MGLVKVIPSVCGHDCGGSCPLNVYVEDGRIIKIESHDVGLPELRPCARGLQYHYRVYAPDRLKYPMKRIGERGEGKFARVSWDEALGEVAEQITCIRDAYGPAAILNHTGSGYFGRLHYSGILARFLNLIGGQTLRWGGASYQGGYFASLATYGAIFTGNDRSDLLNSKMIILWGSNPAESIFGTETRWYLTQAKEKGTKIICVDPRYTESAAAWSSRWIPIRPGTDAAMLVSMAYIILEQGSQSQDFLDTYTVGFDKFRDYVTGAADGVAKTPDWAEKITGVPAKTIATLAQEYAAAKPAAIITGWAPGRSSRGEQYHRATATLSAMTGNIGIHGGSTACLDLTMSASPLVGAEVPENYVALYSDLPQLTNPVEKGQPLHEYTVNGIRNHTIDKVHFTKVWDAILRGKTGGYFSDIKMLYIIGGNGLNQCCNTNKAVKALEKLEFMVVHDHFMTPTAKFADILLPACTWCERNGIHFPWFFGHYLIYAGKAIEPLYESKSDFDILNQLASKMGLCFSDKTEAEWLRLFAAKYGVTDYEAFKADGFYKLKMPEPHVGFKKQIEDPTRNPFPTPSGKIELFSQRIADFNRPDELPSVPKYIEGWEGPTDPKREQYPLQLITVHPLLRIHSQHDNVPWFRERQPREAWINPADATARNIKDRDRIMVSNDRGAISILAKVTERIIPGTVSVFQGAWYDPDPSGLDRGGCANVLTLDEHSPGGAFCSNAALVQVEKI